MSAQSSAVVDRPRSLFRGLVVGRYGYLFLAVVIAVLLIVGDGSKSTTPDAARVAYLESVIRCPSCADLSIADSETTSATGLRTEVVKDVHQGLSDQVIEAQVEGQYPGTLLIPTGGDGVAIFLIPALIIAAGAATFVVLMLRRTRREGSADKSADEAIVEAAQRERMAGR
ncbi:MAG TPA: cytochrome c-type biogenesis protein CcmH [Acidimicrobiales bacterium]